jgi:hypothetical protein
MVVLNFAVAVGSPGAGVGTTATGMFGSGVAPGGGAASVSAGGAVGAGVVASSPQALSTIPTTSSSKKTMLIFLLSVLFITFLDFKQIVFYK